MIDLPLLLLLAPLAPAPVQQGRPQEAWTQEKLEEVTREIRKDIEPLRGLEFQRDVDVAVCDKEGFVRYATERMERMESPDSMAADEVSAKLLGLVPAEMDLLETSMELLQEQVGGFYDPQTDKFFLMDTFTGSLAKIIIAHELTHALDDQHHDLDGGFERTSASTDAELAYAAVVEGCATAIMNAWTVANVHKLDMKELMSGGGGMPGMDAMSEAPPFLWKPLLASYLRGETFLRRGTSVMNLMGKQAKIPDIEHAFKNTPLSTEQVLHPKKYWNERERDDPRAVTIDTANAEAEGWKVLAQDTYGELLLGIFTTPFDEREGLSDNQMAVLGIEYTNQAAEGWGGDRVAVLSKGDAHVLLLATCWDTDKDAGEFLGAAAALADGMNKQLAALCEQKELAPDLRGYRVVSGPASDEVHVVSWIGCDAGTVDALIAKLKVNAEAAGD